MGYVQDAEEIISSELCEECQGRAGEILTALHERGFVLVRPERVTGVIVQFLKQHGIRPEPEDDDIPF